MLLKNAKIIVKGNETRVQDVLVENKKIVQIADFIEASTHESIDLDEKLLLPGGVDVHVHLREPGFTHKETIKTGTKAAARGGYTTIMAMPNILPYPDNVEAIKEYQTLIQKEAEVHVYPFACITRSEAGNQIVDMKAIKACGIHWFSDDGVGVQSEAKMREAMEEAVKQNVIIVAHTEDMGYRKPGACIHEGIRSEQLHLIGIPSACEYKQVARDLQLAYETKAKYHICHMSTVESVELLRKYKSMGANVSGEVTTHHLILSEEDVTDSNDKMNPPLRSVSDRQALIDGLLDGTVDFIANDHAPHTEAEKTVAMDKAPFGVVALETSIPLIYTKFVTTGIFSLEMFQDVLCRKPAERFGFSKKGKIEVGYEADLICLNMQEQIIDKSKFVSKGRNTPFDGYKVKATVALTLVAGKIKYDELGGHSE